MSRRLPKCALCGERLRGAQIRVTYQGLPGTPEVGWHADTEGVDRRRGPLKRCWDVDPMYRALMDLRGSPDADAELEGHLRTIQTRGEDRVSARKAWHEHIALSRVPLWTTARDGGHVVLSTRGGWASTACSHWGTFSTQAEVPRRKCRACVRRLMAGELTLVSAPGMVDARGVAMEEAGDG